MPDRFNVIGCQINRTTMDGALDLVVEGARNGRGGYICFTNVHASVVANQDTSFMQLVNHSFMSLPDGKPIYWVGRLQGLDGLQQVPGPDFFFRMLSRKEVPPLRHYVFGGKQEVLDALLEIAPKKWPDAHIVGVESPPFRPLTDEEIVQSLQRIRDARPDFVWVSLGAPKQEQWMARHWEALRPAVLLGVGAAFDFHAEAVRRAPVWMRKCGFEWLHRFSQEPKRLWKRYLYTNSMFVFLLMKQFVVSFVQRKGAE